MLVGVILMFVLGFWGDFGENLQNCENWEIWLFRRSVGNPCHDLDLRQVVDTLAMARPRCQNGTP